MIPTITRGDATIDVDTLPACPVETTLTLISDKWKILIVRDLLTGTKRFSELRRSIGHISQKALTSNLRQMEVCFVKLGSAFCAVFFRSVGSGFSAGCAVSAAACLRCVGYLVMRACSLR